MNLTRIGVWSSSLRYGDREQARDAAAELESLGYGALWIPDIGGDLFGTVGALLGATNHAVIATGILNLWIRSAEETAARYHDFVANHGDRFLVGIGVSHGPFVERVGLGAYERPLAKTRGYLDELDALPKPLPVEARVLAALGPKMLELARDRSAGAHPYLANPDHTARARAVLGTDRLLCPEQPVVLDTNPSSARQVARAHLAGYLALPNYANNLRRIGLTDDDFSGGGSDRLVDAIVGWGDEKAIARRVQQHWDAGADHVCVQVLTGELGSFPIDQWRRLAPALTG